MKVVFVLFSHQSSVPTVGACDTFTFSHTYAFPHTVNLTLPRCGATLLSPFLFALSLQLPLGHTCFFQVEVPEYSTVEIARQRLLVAINFGIGEFMVA